MQLIETAVVHYASVLGDIIGKREFRGFPEIAIKQAMAYEAKLLQHGFYTYLESSSEEQAHG